MKYAHDNWAEYYDFVYEQTFGQFYVNLTSETLKVINQILVNGEIIDFGAGTGRLTIPLAEQAYKVIAVEKSEGMMNDLKRKLNNSDFKIDLHNCSISDYQNGKADLALALFTVLSYSTTEKELFNNIKNICNHIKPNGYFFFDLPNSIFFDRGRLINIDTMNFKRIVDLKSTDKKDVYSYKEWCSGIFKGKEFNYQDEFEIRFWKLETLDKILVENGFKDTLTEFHQFEPTGSTYKLYKRL